MAAKKHEGTTNKVQETKISRELSFQLQKATSLNQQIQFVLSHYSAQVQKYQGQIQRGVDSRGNSRPTAHKNRARFALKLQTALNSKEPLFAVGQVRQIISEQLPEVKDGRTGFFGGTRPSDYRKILQELQDVLDELQPQWKNYVRQDSLIPAATPEPARQPQTSLDDSPQPSCVEYSLAPAPAHDTIDINQIVAEVDTMLVELSKLSHGDLLQKCYDQEKLIRELNQQATAQAANTGRLEERRRQAEAERDRLQEQLTSMPNHEGMIAALQLERARESAAVKEAKERVAAADLALKEKAERDAEREKQIKLYEEQARQFATTLTDLREDNAKLKKQVQQLDELTTTLHTENSRLTRVIGWLYNTLLKLIGREKKVDFSSAPKDLNIESTCKIAASQVDALSSPLRSASSLFGGSNPSLSRASSSSSLVPGSPTTPSALAPAPPPPMQ